MQTATSRDFWRPPGTFSFGALSLRNVLWSRASVCLYVRGHMPTLLHGPGCNMGNGRECLLAVHYWMALLSVHGLCCYGNITRTRNVSLYTLVLALCLAIRFSRKFSMKTSLTIPPHLKCVITLPCKLLGTIFTNSDQWRAFLRPVFFAPCGTLYLDVSSMCWHYLASVDKAWWFHKYK